jgi:hypothetical protein
METAVNLLIRPPRNEYLPSQLGPTQFTIAGRRYKRHDLEVRTGPLPPFHFPASSPTTLSLVWCSW